MQRGLHGGGQLLEIEGLLQEHEVIVLGEMLAEGVLGVAGNEDEYLAASENAIPGFPRFERTTAVVQQRDSTYRGIRDYRVITVRVAAPGLAQPVVRVHSIGAP